MNPLDEVREAVSSGEVTEQELGDRVGRHRSSVARALAGVTDPPHTVAMKYVEALQAIRAERAEKAAQPSPVASAGDLRSEAV